MKKFEKHPKRKDFEKEYPNIGFNRTMHHEALEKWAVKAEEKIKELQHYRDFTIGLYATDKPDYIKDEQNIMFELNDELEKNICLLKKQDLKTTDTKKVIIEAFKQGRIAGASFKRAKDNEGLADMYYEEIKDVLPVSFSIEELISFGYYVRKHSESVMRENYLAWKEQIQSGLLS